MYKMPFVVFLGRSTSYLKMYLKEAVPGSADPSAIFHFPFRLEQGHMPIFCHTAQDKAFTHQVGDLLGREIHNGDDLFSWQFFHAIEVGDLGRAPFKAQRAKIDQKFIGGFSGLLEHFRRYNGANDHFDLYEFVPIQRVFHDIFFQGFRLSKIGTFLTISAREPPILE